MALPKKNRIVRKKDIDSIFKNGRTVKGSSLFLRFLKGQKGYQRFAFIVPTKQIPLAVDRNKIKRMLSAEVARLDLLERGYDIVVVIHRKVERERFKELRGELKTLLLKIPNDKVQITNQ